MNHCRTAFDESILVRSTVRKSRLLNSHVAGLRRYSHNLKVCPSERSDTDCCNYTDGVDNEHWSGGRIDLHSHGASGAKQLLDMKGCKTTT